jgi:hypothetical protein
LTPEQKRQAEIARAMVLAAGEVPGATLYDVQQAALKIAGVIEREGMRAIWDQAFGDAPALAHMRP